MKTIIFGPPGSGKGTYASRLQAKLDIDIISVGDIFREIIKSGTPLGRKVKHYVEKGQLVPDYVVIDVLRQRLAKAGRGKGFILDGFPRTIEQARALDKMTKVDVVILLTVPDWIIVERLSSRRICGRCGEVYNIHYLKPRVEGVCDKCGGVLYQRADDTAETIRDRIKVYERQTEPILRHYRGSEVKMIEFECKALDMPPDVAVEAILADLKRLRLA